MPFVCSGGKWRVCSRRLPCSQWAACASYPRVAHAPVEVALQQLHLSMGAPAPCACIMRSCKQCSPEVLLEGVADSEESVESGEESDEPESSDMEQEDRAGIDTCAGPAGIDAARPQGPAGTHAARPQRMSFHAWLCFMPRCYGCCCCKWLATPQAQAQAEARASTRPQQVQLARGVGD